jgi:TolB-like protein
VRWKPWVGAACIVVAASLAGVAWLRTRADPAPAAPAVAVLFHNEAGEDLDWLATALTSSLGGALASVSALDVRSTYAVRPYRDGATPVPVLAEELRVQWLVGGTVNRAGDDIVVHAELIDAGMNRRIDAREARGRAGDELTLLATLVGEVEAMLRRHVGGEVRVRDWHAGTRSQRAFQLVHRASQQVSEADRLAEENDLDGAWSRMRLADATLAEAQRADPDWTVPPVERAWLARKTARLLFGNGVVRDSVEAALARGITHADQALARHAGDPRALEARGLVRYDLRLLATPADTAAAARLLDDTETDLQAAADADGSLAASHAALSSIHIARGRPEQARLAAERAYEADAWLESANEILTRLFTINFEAGDDRQALRWCAEIGSRFPDLWYGANCRLLLMAWSDDGEPDADEAWRLARTATASAPEPIRAMVGAQLEVQLAGVLARLVPADSVERVLARARAGVADDPRNAVNRNAHLVLLQYEAAVRVLLGQDEIAARMLAEYFDGRPGDRIQLLRSRRFAALRTDPRFYTGGR